MNECQNCRFACKAGCRKNVCAVVRAHLLSKGQPVPEGKATQAGPEALGPDGLAGYLLRWGCGFEKEYPPTPDGLREVDMEGFYLSYSSRDVSVSYLYRDIDQPATA